MSKIVLIHVGVISTKCNKNRLAYTVGLLNNYYTLLTYKLKTLTKLYFLSAPGAHVSQLKFLESSPSPCPAKKTKKVMLDVVLNHLINRRSAIRYKQTKPPTKPSTMFSCFVSWFKVEGQQDTNLLLYKLLREVNLLLLLQWYPPWDILCTVVCLVSVTGTIRVVSLTTMQSTSCGFRLSVRR